MAYDSNGLFSAKFNERRFLLICVNDYDIISKELDKRCLLINPENYQEEEQQNKSILVIRDFRLLKFFGVTTQKSKRSSTLAEDENLECHASYTEDEFVLVVVVGKRNQEVLLKYNMKVCNLKKMIRTLQISRRSAHAKFYINNERV